MSHQTVLTQRNRINPENFRFLILLLDFIFLKCSELLGFTCTSEFAVVRKSFL